MKKTNLIAIILFASILVSCGSGAGGNDTTDDKGSETGETTTSGITTAERDSLPELDFDGGDVTFLVRTDNIAEIYAEGENGDIVNDAIYKSRVAVEERLKVKFNIVDRAGTSPGDRNTYADHLSQTVMAGDDTYDWAEMMAAVYPGIITKGILTDLSDAKYIDTDRPWWGGDLKEQASIGGSLYFLVGEYSIGYLNDAFCVYFNKQLIDDYKLEDPYELVRNGDWTLDKLMEMSAAASEDLNGDGVFDYEDKLGFVTHDLYHLCGFMISNENNMFTRVGNDFEYTFGTEHDFDVVTKMHKLLFETDGGFLFNGAKTTAAFVDDYKRLTTKFTSGEILMMSAQMGDAISDLRDMKQDYGILPYPKYDKAQENYRTASRTTHSAISMPVTCSDRDKAFATLEAFAAANHEYVIPTYYETALKTKYSRDDESAEMYDLILSSLSLDFGYLYDKSTVTDGNKFPPTELFISGVKDPTTFISNCASRKEASTNSYKSFVETIIEANDK